MIGTKEYEVGLRKEISHPSPPLTPPRRTFRRRIPFLACQQSGYDPARSKVSDDTLQQFISGEPGLDLLKVPGIGPKAVEFLAKESKYSRNDVVFIHYLLCSNNSVPPDITIIPHLLA